MQFMGTLYVGESISTKEYEIVRKVHNRKLVSNLYLITFSTNADNMLDLVPQKDVVQECYPTSELKIVGIAGDKKEAIGLVQKIITESMQETGSVDVRNFLKTKWEEQACR